MIDEPASAERGQAGLSRRAAAALLVGTVAFVGFGLGQAWTDGPTSDEATELTSARPC